MVYPEEEVLVVELEPINVTISCNGKIVDISGSCLLLKVKLIIFQANLYALGARRQKFMSLIQWQYCVQARY